MSQKMKFVFVLIAFAISLVYKIIQNCVSTHHIHGVGTQVLMPWGCQADILPKLVSLTQFVFDSPIIFIFIVHNIEIFQTLCSSSIQVVYFTILINYVYTLNYWYTLGFSSSGDQLAVQGDARNIYSRFWFSFWINNESMNLTPE